MTILHDHNLSIPFLRKLNPWMPTMLPEDYITKSVREQVQHMTMTNCCQPHGDACTQSVPDTHNRLMFSSIILFKSLF